MSQSALARRQRAAAEPEASSLSLTPAPALTESLPAPVSSAGHSLGAFAIQRCGPVPCDCSEEERDAYEESSQESATHEHGYAAGRAAVAIQRAPDDMPPPDSGGGGSTLGGDQSNGAVPLDTSAAGSTTIHAPTMRYQTYSAPTITALERQLPDEVGAVDFDFSVRSSGDPITRATLDVTQVMTMPRWLEYSRQCPPVRQAWDSFYSALRSHEDGHVAIDNQQFPGQHSRFIGQAQSDTQSVSTQLRADVQAAQDAYDSTTDHGRQGNPPTILDTTVTCTPTSATSEPGAADLGEGGDTSAETTETMQAARADGGDTRLRANEVTASVRAVVGSGGGQPLDGDTRSFMESRFGHDFSQVRVHADAEASRSAESARALAYTVGSEIVFAAGRYAPQTDTGRHLLAHELTHVVQQSAGPVSGAPLGNGLTISDPSDSYEQAAETTARSVMSGESVATSAGTSSLSGQAQRLVQRDAGPPAATPAETTAPDVVTDSEGNAVTTTAGRQYLTAIPAHVTWHKGQPQGLPPNPKAVYTALHAQCEAIRDKQLMMAMALRGDEKYWFAKVYHFVTKHELMQIDAQVYQYPLMKMQEVIAFDTTYEQNLQNWIAGNKDKVESNWRAAFSAAEDSPSWYRTRAVEIMDALLPSMQAHIRFDLPRAIAACFQSNYAGIPGLSMTDFHPDFDAMGPVFDAAQADLQPEIDAATHWITPEFGLDPTNWHWAQSVGFPFIFNVPMEREHSWDKATDIVSGENNGITDPAKMRKRLEAYSTARHPFSGSSDFEVDGEDIDDYDWIHQPK